MRTYPFPVQAKAIEALQKEVDAELKTLDLDIAKRIQNKKCVGFEHVALLFRKKATLQHALADKEAKRSLQQCLLWYGKALEWGEFITPFAYAEMLAIALITRDENQSKWLLGMDEDYFRHPKIAAHDAEMLFTQIFRNLALGKPDGLQDKVDGLRKALTNGAPPAPLKAQLDCMAPALGALVQNSGGEFSTNFTMRYMNISSFLLKNPGEVARSPYNWLLDLLGLGVARLALNRGMQCSVESPMLPLDLSQ